RMEYTGGGLIL
ncbi:putative ER membrane protein, partial [Naja naja]